MMRPSTSLAIAMCLVAITGCAGTTKAAGGTATPNTASSPPEPKEPQLAGDGFFMDVPKWTPPDAGNAKGLRASYRWGTGEQRSIRASDGGDYWRLVFQDKPRPSDIARVELHYEYELSKIDIAKIDAAVTAVVDEAEKAVNAAALSTDQKTPLADRIAVGSSTIVRAAKPLDAFTAADGTKGSSVVLKALGFKQRDDGSWEPTGDGLKALVRLAEEHVRANTKRLEAERDDAQTRLSKVAATASEAACAAAVNGASAKGDDPAKVTTECAAAIKSAIDARVAALPKTATADEVKALTGLQTWAAKLVAKAPAITTSADADEDVSEARAELARDASVKNSYSFHAFDYGRAAVKLAAAKAVNAASIGKLKGELRTRVETLQSDRPGSVVLQENGEKRIYDVSTGVVYVAGLDDTVVPILISVCPVPGGCLHKGEAFFDSPTTAARGLSVDLGVRAQTLDKSDPRNSGALAFLLGASWNPLFFVRVSGGLYNFENAQTDNWNVAGYVGATVNVLQAAELLGVVGLGTPSAPKIVGH